MKLYNYTLECFYYKINYNLLIQFLGLQSKASKSL